MKLTFDSWLWPTKPSIEKSPGTREVGHERPSLYQKEKPPFNRWRSAAVAGSRWNDGLGVMYPERLTLASASDQASHCQSP